MTMQVHSNYARLVDLARESHEKGRTPAEITSEDVALARLYSYAFRGHTIGAFHATRVAIDEIEMCDPLTEAHRKRGGRAPDRPCESDNGLWWKLTFAP